MTERCVKPHIQSNDKDKTKELTLQSKSGYMLYFIHNHTVLSLPCTHVNTKVSVMLTVVYFLIFHCDREWVCLLLCQTADWEKTLQVLCVFLNYLHIRSETVLMTGVNLSHIRAAAVSTDQSLQHKESREPQPVFTEVVNVLQMFSSQPGQHNTRCLQKDQVLDMNPDPEPELKPGLDEFSFTNKNPEPLIRQQGGLFCISWIMQWTGKQQTCIWN